jgi:hypothetical protein
MNLSHNPNRIGDPMEDKKDKLEKFNKMNEYDEPMGFNIFPWVMGALVIASIVAIILKHI